MRSVIVLLSFLAATMAIAQPAPQRSLSASMEVYVFPTQGQDASQQSMEEAECYNWATQNTGVDPFELAKEAEQTHYQAEAAKQQAASSTRGAGAAGAVGGAAMGALIGGIARNDPGRGAAWGAAAGAVAGRRRAQHSQYQAEQQINQQAGQSIQATAHQIENFKKAFSVCLEAKEYMVRY